MGREMKIIFTIFISLISAALITAQPLGDVIGTTYPYPQNIGPTGSRIGVCDDNSIYICWTNVLGWPYPPAPRHVFGNWQSTDGDWLEDGYQISQYAGCGFINSDIIYNNLGAFVFHSTSNEPVIIVAIEWDPPGLGFFDYFIAPNEVHPQTPYSPGICMWPQITVDRNDNIHLVMTESAEMRWQRFCYTRSEDGGTSWTDVDLVDNVVFVSGIVISSPVSDKVAIVYIHADDTISQAFNWPNYVVSDDGLNWDFADGIIEVPYPYAPNFDLWAYRNIDAIFDYNDELHLAWPVYGEGCDWLLHYREGADTIEVISQIPDTTTNHPIYSLLIDQVSLSRWEDPSALFAAWCQYNDSDTNTAGDYNGEIYISQSDDNGLNWETPRNITNSPSPNCDYGNCHSEIYPCADEEADSLPHIAYIYDPFFSPDSVWDNLLSVMYLGPEHMVDINQPPDDLPSSYFLSQNFPNPFNAVTTIQYNLPEQSYVTIEIYNILGQKVKSLLSDEQPAGYHSAVWQADGFTSGSYFYKIQAGNFTQTKSCLLLK